MMDYKLNLSEEDYAIAASNDISRSLAYQRYYCGWTAEESITKPKGNSGKLKKYKLKQKQMGWILN